MPPAVEVSRPPFRLRGGRWSGGSRLGPLLSAAEPGGRTRRASPPVLPQPPRRPEGRDRRGGARGWVRGTAAGLSAAWWARPPAALRRRQRVGSGEGGGLKGLCSAAAVRRFFGCGPCGQPAGGGGCVVGRREDPCPSLCLWLLRLTLARSGRVSFTRHVYICCLMQ